MSISQLSKLRSKEQWHGKRKTNFKKSKSTKRSVECCICFSMVPKIADNSIMCDKTVNYICGECKFKCNETKNTLCPCVGPTLLKTLWQGILLSPYPKNFRRHALNIHHILIRIYHQKNSEDGCVVVVPIFSHSAKVQIGSGVNLVQIHNI